MTATAFAPPRCTTTKQVGPLVTLTDARTRSRFAADDTEISFDPGEVITNIEIVDEVVFW
jgi:hypothetical protein